MRRFGDAPDGLCGVLIGDRDVGEALVDDGRVAVVSATGSTTMGRAVGPRLAARFARAILELGGNNAIVAPSADLDLAVRAIAFAAMGTAGQRCTTLRRLLSMAISMTAWCRGSRRSTRRQRLAIHASKRRSSVRSSIGTLSLACSARCKRHAMLAARQHGGERIEGIIGGEHAYYVRPALCEMPEQTGPVLRETFAPIFYVMRYSNLGEAIRLHNAVGAGLSSSIFTLDMREAETFLSTTGSDCGIANVNIGPSGAEIGGAFGGEKETGGGREAGSDAWKAYMRRATNTINFGAQLPLAQGVKFDIAE